MADYRGVGLLSRSPWQVCTAKAPAADEDAVGAQAVAHLAALGYRQIAMLRGDDQLPVPCRWYIGGRTTA